MKPSLFVDSAMENSGKAPDGNLQLDYVYGCHSYAGPLMVRYANPENIVFTSGGVGVQMNTKNRTQSFFQMHNSEIQCIDVHPKKHIIATGGTKGTLNKKNPDIFPEIYIWTIDTKKVLSQMKGFHLNGITLLRFSPDGRKLLTIGQDDFNSLAIYEWASSRLIMTA